MRKYLLTPGPVELPPAVAEASSRPLISHRCSEFYELFEGIENKLGRLLSSASPVVVLPSSGTGALECAAVNFLKPGDRFLSLSCGAFGERFREIAARRGAAGIYADFAPGTAPDARRTAELLSEHQDVKAVLVTHNETSTGVTAPLAEIAAAVRAKSSALVIADGVSSVGAIECLPEKWGVDVLCTASQKGLMTPPGLGLVWLSQRAVSLLDGYDCPSYYFDLKLHLKNMKSGSFANPYTPPVSLYYALNAALDIILENGAAAWFDKRKKFAKGFAEGLEQLGFELFVKEAKLRSPGLTAFSLKNGKNTEFRRLLSAAGFETAGGQGALKDKIVRAAHYTDWNNDDMQRILAAFAIAAASLEGNE